jgi:hypothetical protein
MNHEIKFLCLYAAQSPQALMSPDNCCVPLFYIFTKGQAYASTLSKSSLKTHRVQITRHSLSVSFSLSLVALGLNSEPHAFRAGTLPLESLSNSQKL